MDSRNDMQLSHIWDMLEEKMRENYQGTKLSYDLWFGRMQLRYLNADSAVFVCVRIIGKICLTAFRYSPARHKHRKG